MPDRGLLVRTAPEVRTRGIEACLHDAIEHATDGVDRVYLTVDIDCVDLAYAPGTGTPEPGGLTAADLLEAMDILGGCEAVRALDLMEVAPKLDPTEFTQRLGANAIVRFLESKFLSERVRPLVSPRPGWSVCYRDRRRSRRETGGVLGMPPLRLKPWLANKHS